jgi:hypothetical protein
MLHDAAKYLKRKRQGFDSLNKVNAAKRPFATLRASAPAKERRQEELG